MSNKLKAWDPCLAYILTSSICVLLEQNKILNVLLYYYKRYVSAKEVDPSTLDQTQFVVVEVVCLVEETFPLSTW